MWKLLQKIYEQVTNYSTYLGQLWYLCSFLFRLIGVAFIGGVYGDEESSFVCNTKQASCRNMCFSEFSNISHIRFWTAQLLFVAVPVIGFHVYSTDVAGHIQKLRKDEETINAEVPFTKKIRIAYFLSVFARLVVEAVFLRLGYGLFKLMDTTSSELNGALDFIWIRVPGMYACTNTSAAVKHACYQTLGNKKYRGFIACWVSSPSEKTIFMRYMNVLNVICFVLCALELIYLAVRWLTSCLRKRHSRKSLHGLHRNGHRQDSVFYVAETSAHLMNHETPYPFQPTADTILQRAKTITPIKHGAATKTTCEGTTTRIYG